MCVEYQVMDAIVEMPCVNGGRLDVSAEVGVDGRRKNFKHPVLSVSAHLKSLLIPFRPNVFNLRRMPVVLKKW